MSIFKKCQVLMLPTNEKANLYLHKTKGLFLLAFVKHELGQYNGSNQHLYILSDEEIKEGDWYIMNNTNHITKATEQITTKDWSKKIIATTDKSLELVTKNVDGLGNDLHEKLPQPSQQFIEKYITEYNNGNIIEYVNVEYEQPFPGNPSIFDCLKVNPDNTINISPIKDSWNREEIIGLLKDFRNGLVTVNDREIHYTNKWIEENL